MKDLNSVISGLSKSGLLSGLAGGLAGGALAGGLKSKKVRKAGGTVLKAGALAAVGGLAWKAYQNYSNNQKTSQQSAVDTQGQSNLPLNTPHQTYIPQERFEAVVAENESETGSLLLLKAMISAANADGHIDSSERKAIFDQVGKMKLSPQDKGQLFDELENPLDVIGLISLVPNPETGMEVYAAALMAIDESQPASRTFLNQLATGLGLPSELVHSMHQQVNQARSGNQLYEVA